MIGDILVTNMLDINDVNMSQKQLDYSVLTHDQTLEYNEISDFINAVSSDFVPHFLSYVDFPAYYSKVVKNGNIIVCRCDGILAGVLFFYCNNLQTKEAYASFLAVSPNFRKMGIAKSMMKLCIDFSKGKGMQSIRLRTNSEIALRTYLNLGYELKNKIFEEEIGLFRYYLERKI